MVGVTEVGSILWWSVSLYHPRKRARREAGVAGKDAAMPLRPNGSPQSSRRCLLLDLECERSRLGVKRVVEARSVCCLGVRGKRHSKRAPLQHGY